MDGNIIFKVLIVRISIVLLTMPLTRFLFAAHFRKKQAKKFKREYLKNYTSLKANFVLQKMEKEKVSKKRKKKCKIFDVSFFAAHGRMALVQPTLTVC